MSGRGKHVKVFVRVRPTAKFAHGMIDLQDDNKVEYSYLKVVVNCTSFGAIVLKLMITY